MSWFKDIIKNKKKTLAKRSEGILTALAKSCVYAWEDTTELDKILQDSLNMLPFCDLIYAVDTSGTLISSNIEAHKKDSSLRGRALSGRPYMEKTLPYKGFTMSPIYISKIGRAHV